MFTVTLTGQLIISNHKIPALQASHIINSHISTAKKLLSQETPQNRSNKFVLSREFFYGWVQVGDGRELVPLF